MDPVAITVGCAWTLTSLLIILLSVPLVFCKVARNSFYGIRFPESFQSDQAWYAINRFGGQRLIFWAIPLIFIGVISFFLPLLHHTALTLTFGFAPLIFILIPLFESRRFARRYRPRS